MPQKSDEVRPLVLCVDDHSTGLEVRKVLLETSGFRVHTATSGKTALQIAKKHAYQAAVLDYRMPDMDGFELAFQMRKQFPDLPLIVLTGYVGELPVPLCAMVDTVLAKGVDAAQLVSELRRLTGTSKPAAEPRLSTQEMLSRNSKHARAVNDFLAKQEIRKKA